MPPQNINAAQALPLQAFPPPQQPLAPTRTLDDYRLPPDRQLDASRGSPAPAATTWATVPSLIEPAQETRAAPAAVEAQPLAAQSYGATQYAASTAVASAVALERPALQNMDITAEAPQLALADNPNSLAIKGIVLGVIFAPVGLLVSLIAHKRHRTAHAQLLSRIGMAVSTAGIAVMIVATLALASSFATVKNHNRDIVMQNRVGAVEPEIQATFIKNGTYPTLAQINSNAWRSVNMIGTSAAGLSPSALKPALLVGGKATKHAFAYTAFPTHCSGSLVSPCTSFSLAAQQSSGVDYAVN